MAEVSSPTSPSPSFKVAAVAWRVSANATRRPIAQGPPAELVEERHVTMATMRPPAARGLHAHSDDQVRRPRFGGRDPKSCGRSMIGKP